MENCGALIKHEREKRNINQTQMVDMCQFSANSTISRIESNKTSPSFAIVVHIFSKFNIGPGYVFEKLTGKSINLGLQPPRVNIFSHPKNSKGSIIDEINDQSYDTPICQPIHLQEIISISDLEIFNLQIEEHLEATTKIFSDWINLSCETILKNIPQNPNRLKVNLYPKFTPDTIQNLYIPNPIINHGINYPSLSNNTIFDILKNGGGIMPTDSAQYIKNLRQQKKESIQNISEKVGIAHTTLQKIEQAQNARIDIYDVIKLDEILKADGVVFNLMWNAEEFINSFGFPQKDLRGDYQIHQDRNMYLIKTFVTLSRWWYTIPGRDNTWLSTLKTKLQAD